MDGQAGRLAERFAATDAEVALMLVSDGGEPRDGVLQMRAVLDDDVDVDDRASGQSWHRCATHMLDPIDEVAKRRTNPRGQRLEGLGPALVVVADLDRRHPPDVTERYRRRPRNDIRI